LKGRKESRSPERKLESAPALYRFALKGKLICKHDRPGIKKRNKSLETPMA
jgi:hypothetical protein